MTKNIIGATLLFVAAAVGFSSCKKIACEALEKTIVDRFNVFQADPTPANCAKYKISIQDILDTEDCAPVNSTNYLKYKSKLDSLIISCP